MFARLNMLAKGVSGKLWTKGKVHSRFTGNRSYATYKRFNNNSSTDFTKLLLDESGRKYLAVTFGLGGLFYVTHLEKAPLSERNRFIWVPIGIERQIGNYSYKSILNQTKGAILPENHPLTLRVDKIFRKIVQAAMHQPGVDQKQIENIQWKIHIVNDARAPPNAFVLPNGKVFVFSSMLNICQNDDGIATVLSHEFAHQLARHTAENLSKAPLYSLLGIILYTVTGTEGINRLLLDGILRMPASRQMETEADYIGLMLMSRACFQPNESVRLWERMTQFEKRTMNGANFEFLSTHPASSRRIENMQKWLPQARQIYEQSECGMFTGFQNSIFNTAESFSNSIWH
ncbi:Mitochondrial metalloendopeptidase OMA1 [Nakaseomyces glabratus]|uniref:Mitochondrial metalloendopeptidase OMA1 n=1 Tax=Candida glabrata TaxID=5478 RepID=A0A0W0EBX5_CANGB|nr:Peptidase family M48 [Nakaseomyces glabratus]KAH7602216.1 Peptidase family M48 [Nakaseomyces glabratus]KAH7613606.1 Peptidase family M48 [Nakaseomyces glabratus]KAI8397645.1 Peptidase family M48 [Nakaseomyces glabratus]KTA95436.1 Mitochondrial metalloendopeptidase OMA1 [Nakaseomyces glabratus]